MNYQYKGDKIKPIDLSKKLTPKAIQETCDNICSEAIKEYPKVLEIQAKLIGKIDKKKKTKLVKKFTKECHSKCEKTLHEAKEIIPMMDKLQKKQDKSKKKKKKKNKKKTKRGGCSSRGGGKKRTVRKSKLKGNKNSAYFEFKKGSSRKFWRITKKGTKIITQYGRLMSLGQMTTKDYGSKVDQEYDKLIQSKKKKGYVEKWDFGSPNPKKPTAIEREYMKICNKAERSKVLNPNQINSDCEAMLDQGESELKWMTGWYKDALKKGEYDWDKYTEHNKSRRKK